MQIKTKIADLKTALADVNGEIDLYIEDGILETSGGFSKKAYKELVKLLADKAENSVTLYLPDGMLLATLFDVSPAIKQIVFPHSIIAVEYGNYIEYDYDIDDEQNRRPHIFKFSSIVEKYIEKSKGDGYVDLFEFYETDKPQFPAGEYEIEIYSHAATEITCHDVSNCDKSKMYENDDINIEELFNQKLVWGIIGFSEGFMDNPNYNYAEVKMKLKFNGREIILIMDDGDLALANGVHILKMYQSEYLELPDTPNILRCNILKHLTMTSSAKFENGFNFSDILVEIYMEKNVFNVQFIDGIGSSSYSDSRSIGIDYIENW